MCTAGPVGTSRPVGTSGSRYLREPPGLPEREDAVADQEHVAADQEHADPFTEQEPGVSEAPAGRSKWNLSCPLEFAASGTDDVQVNVFPRWTSVGCGSDSSHDVRRLPG